MTRGTEIELSSRELFRAKKKDANTTFIRLQSLIQTLAALLLAGILPGERGGVEFLLGFQPGFVAL